MARSRRHTPIVPVTTATSEKQDKRRANRNLRAAVGHALRHGDLEARALPQVDDVSSPWSMAKDGRQWVGDRRPELLRK